MYDEIGKILILISENLSSRYNFYRYTYKEEMVSDGILRAIAAFKNFNVDLGQKPFAYFTRVIFRAFIARIKNEKQKRKAIESLIFFDEIFSLQEGDDSFKKEFITDSLEFNNWNE